MLRPSTAVLRALVLSPPLLALLTLAAASPVRAHAIESTLERLQGLHDTLVLDSRFGSGQPAAGAQVSLVSPGGEQSLVVGSTDQQGSLRFQLPAGVGPSWELKVDLGAGHRDYLELPATLSTRTSSAFITVPAVSPERPQRHWLDAAPWLLVGGVALWGGFWGGLWGGFSGGLQLNYRGRQLDRKLNRKRQHKPDRNRNHRS